MVNGSRISNRWLIAAVVMLAGCASGGDSPGDAAAIDARVTDAAPVDGPQVDAPAIDARPIDARPIDAPTDALTDAAIDAAIDASIDASMPATCDPLAPPGQAGCAVGQKCTWIIVEDIPQTIGMLGCVPAGPVPLGGACTVGPPGAMTGYDNCADGAICISGTCQDVCGFGGGVNDACAAGSSCTRYSGLYANGADDPVAGACRPNCDPITQNQCPANQGCYVLVSNTTTTAVCAAAGNVGGNQVIQGPAFANSCLPGYQPRRRDELTNTVECGALCRPADVTSTTNMASEGGVAPATCAARGAALPGDAVNGESCRYWWAREPFANLSPFSNTLGWCFRHPAFHYDSDLNGTNDAPFPRCINLTTGDVVPPIGNPPHNDAQYFWCVTLNNMFAHLVHPVARPPTAEPAFDRLGGWH